MSEIAKTVPKVSEENFNQEVFEPIEEHVITEVKSENPSVEVEQPKVEPPEPVQEIDYSQLTDEQLTKLGVDVPKSFKHFQSLAEQRKSEIERYRQQAEAAEAKVREFESQKPKEEVQQPQELIMPVKPQRPDDYDPSDIYDKNSSTYKYEQALRDYRDQKETYQDSMLQKVASTIKEQQDREAQTAYVQAHRQKWVGDFLSQPGATPERAAKAYEKFIKGGTATADNIWKLFLISEGENIPQAPVKKNGEIPSGILPPGVTNGGINEPLKSPDDMFNESIKTDNRKSWI